MRSGRVKKPTAGVSLFPFLAVLICTMGAIIVLLIMVVQQARVQAAVVQRDKAEAELLPAAGPDEEREREDFEWRREMLEKQRGELTEKLAEQRLELGHLEDHIRRLQDQWRRMVAQAEELNKAGKSKQSDQAAIDIEKDRLRSEIDHAKRELEEAKEKLAKKPRSFAIIPYQGPNGTHRRPIYIECRGDAIIFQPEGVVLGPADFEGPLGPGNPFDAALRATREYLASAGAKQGGEPYPLLVVRPNGAVAYALARSAMKSWDDEFGYELVDQEMKLAFPPADPQLSITLNRALQDARRRQEMLARMAPSRFKGIGAGPGRGNGGEGSLAGGGFNERYAPELESRREPGQGGGFVLPSGSPGTGPQASGSSQGGNSTGGFYGSDLPHGKSGTPGSLGQAGFAPSSGSAGTSRPASGSAQAGATGRGSYGSNPPRGKPGTPGSLGQAGEEQANGDPAGRERSENLANAGRASASDSGTTASSTPQAGAPQTGAPPAGASFGMPSFSLGSDPRDQNASTDLSPPEERKPRIRRGTPNWGLPNSSGSAVGYTRPIRVTCSAQRLVILPERGDGEAPRVVPLVADAPAPIDDFVAAVWKHMDRWGIAGTRAYWKPVLSVQVAPGGEERFAELEAQLQGSGLEIKRK
jgi:hypothetical protein